MSIELVIADLESKFSASLRAEAESMVAEMVPAYQSGITLLGRLKGSLGQEIELTLTDGRVIDGCLLRATKDWVLLRTAYESVLIPLSQVNVFGPLGKALMGSHRLDNLSMGTILRDLADKKSLVRLFLLSGNWLGHVVSCGSDWIGFRVYETRKELIVPLTAIVSISTPVILEE
ncbi:hypothetical protein BK816_03490 [Boudabousia tangfeifanii]|uniref:Uncharacterized protein n=1 Tax=Boudabousia tangfeifanii TaxID=1912795 RepID=A0A1D9MJK9_9ACTO|nr:hypothetical protein [Boudabousia tangfeifanii]AOZ72472.1 hypothetical protein BK816_03490 [Boudabousia tangfeifanii]